MLEKLRLLNLEDSPRDAELNKALLEEEGFHCELIVVETREDFLKAIEGGDVDIILADYSLPSYDGLSALDLTREHCPDVPFLFVSGTLGEEIAIDSLKRGATDYIVKDRLERLPTAVRRALMEKAEKVERRRAEKALAESENTLKSIVRAAPVGIGFTIDRVILEVNEQLCRMLGYQRNEMIGRSAKILYPSDEEFKYVGDEKYRQIEEQGAGTVETRWVRKDGTLIDVLLSSSPIEPNNRSAGVTFTALDITQRKQAELALKISEEKYRNFIDNAPIGMFAADTHGVFTYGNRKIDAITGYRQSEQVGKKFDSVVYPEDFPIILDRIKRRKSGEDQSDPYEIRMLHASGRVMWVKVIPESLFETDALGQKKFVGMQAFLEDITDRKAAEDALRRSEGRLSKLIAQTFDIIYETDASGFIKSISPQSEQVFGLKPEALKGRHLQELLRETERERVLEQFHRAMRRERVGTIEFVGKKQDGSEVHCELRQVLEEEQGRVVGTFGVIRDITERYKMQTHLQQSQKMEAIGTLAGGIAHDFNNILGAIIGYTQLALYDLPEKSPLKYNFDQVLKASDRARELVKQILSFSRQSSQEQGPFHVLPVLKEGLKLLRASLPKSIDIQKNLSIKEDTIIGDPTQIHQVIMNLCTNAAQAIGEKQGCININLDELVLVEEDRTAYPGLTEGHYLRLSVRDTGTGIEPAVLPRIFDPFFTTKGPGQGTGMGLAVVHGIVKSHRGEITVYSEPGIGTTFRIYLPQIKRSADREKRETGPLPGGHERILFVDDEPAIVESWVEMLGHLGYQVFSRTSSREALESFRTAPEAFDLVISDQTMPQISGVELAKAMLALRPDLPIILCSGYSENISPENARELGIRKYLMKPILLGEIAVVIRKILDGESG